MPALYFGDGAYSIDSTNDKNQEIDDSDVDVIYIPADTSDGKLLNTELVQHITLSIIKRYYFNNVVL